MMPDVETLERKREEHIISMFQEPKKARGHRSNEHVNIHRQTCAPNTCLHISIGKTL